MGFFDTDSRDSPLEQAVDCGVFNYVDNGDLAASLEAGTDVERVGFGSFAIHIGFDKNGQRRFWVENISDDPDHFHVTITLPSPYPLR